MKVFLPSVLCVAALLRSFDAEAACQNSPSVDTSSCITLNSAPIVFVENGLFGEGLSIYLNPNVAQTYSTPGRELYSGRGDK